MKKVTHAALQIIIDEHVALAAVLRAMLFYIDEFPEKRHHPNESNLLFPKLALRAPELMPVIHKLEADHLQGEGRVRDLQHQLLAWELLGDARRGEFIDNLQAYIRFYLDHMRIEETQLLPVAVDVLEDADWIELDRAFEAARDPLAGGLRDPAYDRLFTRIVLAAPAPIGVGAELRGKV